MEGFAEAELPTVTGLSSPLSAASSSSPSAPSSSPSAPSPSPSSSSLSSASSIFPVPASRGADHASSHCLSSEAPASSSGGLSSSSSHHWRHHYHHFCHLKRHHYVQYPYDHKVVDLANLHPGIEHYYRGTSNSKLSYKKIGIIITSRFNMGI